MFKNLKSYISVITVSTFMVGLLAFVPQSLAADFIFNPTPANEYTTGGVTYPVNVKYTVMDAEADIQFKVGKKGLAPTLIASHTFKHEDETYKFEWDGKIAGQIAPAAGYELFIMRGNITMLTHSFTVKNPPQDLNKAILSFNNPPADSFNIKTKSTIDFQVRLNQVQKPTDIKFQIQPIGQNAFNVKTMEYTESGTKIFSWDGEHMGDDMPVGTYEAIFSGEGITPISHIFQLVTAEPKLAFTTPAVAQYVQGSGKYKVSVDLSAYKTDTKVTAAVILSDANIYIPQDEYTFTANGTHEFSWDIPEADYKAGSTYSVKISGEDTENNPTNALDYDLKVLKSQPTLSFTANPLDTYTMGTGTYKASVKLTGFSSNTAVAAYIVNPENNLDIPKADFNYTKEEEIHLFEMDMAQYKAGNYEMRIYGKDKNDVETNILSFKFKIIEANGADNGAIDPNSCAGYKDLKKTDWSCDAAIWAKSKGIITGQAGGDYIDGYSYLNRAEITKIALTAFNQYDRTADYCGGGKPFWDVHLNQWYTNYICRAKALKFVTGYLGGADAGQYISPRSVTVLEMFAILLRPTGKTMSAGMSYSGLKPDQWYSAYAKYAKDHNLYSSAGFNPTKEATRFEALNFLYALHNDGAF